MPSKTLYGYFAGALFSNKDICGNAMLANIIFEQSEGALLPILPQNLEQRVLQGAAIRNTDLIALARADWALFHFDGSELDSGTVLEHEFAKLLDIPCVILRTDFRASGDAADLPWNLMNRPGPRGSTVVVDAMGLYQKGLFYPQGDSSLGHDAALELLKASIQATQHMHGEIAKLVINKLCEVLYRPPILDVSELTAALSTCAKTTGGGFEVPLNSTEIGAIVTRRSTVWQFLTER
jgi:nucleoside 2-deoxyribosyltransferase